MVDITEISAIVAAAGVLVEGRRKELDPTLRKWFEYLYNELKKREQRQ